MEDVYRVIWDRKAKEALRTIVDYIRKDSDQAANNVKEKLLEVASGLSKMPERYSPEAALAHLPGNYRSVRQWHYKIVYKIDNQNVFILTIFHERRNPDSLADSV